MGFRSGEWVAVHTVLLNLVCLSILISVYKYFSIGRGGSILLKNYKHSEGEDGYNCADLVKETKLTLVVLVSIK